MICGIFIGNYCQVSMFLTFESMVNESWPVGNWSLCSLIPARHKCLSREGLNTRPYHQPFIQTLGSANFVICILVNTIGRCCVTCWDIYTVVGSLKAWRWIEPNFWWSWIGPYIKEVILKSVTKSVVYRTLNLDSFILGSVVTILTSGVR